MSLFAIIALLLFLFVPAFAGGGGKQSSKPPAAPSPSPTVDLPKPNLPGIPPPETPQGNGGVNQPTPVPTPALLPGLIGLGVQVARKRKSEAKEATNDIN
ncbi:MAG TPA: PTPA-CTERM sorting domain-containing protein [Leptolyngbyaceae cyanobacterium M33_DOE_097]|uniref:PTPA-CTERM sorting domain-containing protein n=1 Tax=Oscillatoriales cyanobacterium SpSt-418 TaxID=2282169 RepID=A0A7C3KD42_9CYAN|nr:PTPA-CTERM sorting domain-containing protein [Leptolyngbyaceae cyanobacterium M33_DOE_097]